MRIHIPKVYNHNKTKLDEISQQIAIYSRDTSEVGKARLAQLKQEYADLQEQMNEGN